MNYYTEILTRIKTAIGSSDVSTVAGLSNAEWVARHIFDHGRSFIHGQNRGRVPFVNVWRNNSDYNFEAVEGAGQRAGSLESSWSIEVVVGKSLLSNDMTNEEFAYAIMQKIIKSIRNEYNMTIGTESYETATPHPFGLSLVATVSIINTHSDSNK